MAQTEGYSLDAQQEKLRKYAEYKNLDIVGEYCDAIDSSTQGGRLTLAILSAVAEIERENIATKIQSRR